MPYKDGTWGIKAQKRDKKRGPYLSKYFHDKHLGSRNKLIDKMGGKCVKCSFSDIRALHVDHIHGGGNKERQRLGPRYWKKVLESVNNNEEKYQLLCANCNSIKRYENNELKGVK